MTDPADRSERTQEEFGRTRNNEDGGYYPTPKEDSDPVNGINQEILLVAHIFDTTDDIDGRQYPLK